MFMYVFVISILQVASSCDVAAVNEQGENESHENTDIDGINEELSTESLHRRKSILKSGRSSMSQHLERFRLSKAGDEEALTMLTHYQAFRHVGRPVGSPVKIFCYYIVDCHGIVASVRDSHTVDPSLIPIRLVLASR